MHLEAIIYDPLYRRRIGTGPLHPLQATITRVLDGVGQGRMTLAAGDTQATDLIQPRRIVEIWLTQPDALPQPPAAPHQQGRKRKLGAFLIQDVTVRDTDDGRLMVVSGADTLQRLKDAITLPGLIFNEQSVAAVMGDLAALAGWQVVTDAALTDETISVRFDGDSALRAMQVVAQMKGLHLRLHDEAQTVFIGRMGHASGLRVQYAEGWQAPALTSHDLTLLQRMEHITDAADVVNSALAMGGGQGDAALTLEKSTRPGITPINANGRTHYLIQDAASIAQYGEIRKRVNIKRLAPVENTDEAIEAAANALYDGVYQWLQRHKQPHSVLQVRSSLPTQALNAGDTVRVAYNGLLNKDGAPYAVRDIDGDFWVMQLTEHISADGAYAEMMLTDVDRFRQNAAGVVVGAIDAISVNENSVQPAFNSYQWGPYQRAIDPDNAVTLALRITGDTVALNRVVLVVRTEPFIATTKPKAHHHQVFATPSTTLVGGTRYLTGASAGGSTLTPPIIIEMIGDPTPVYTLTADPGAEYGIYTDSMYPADVLVSVNGVTVASGIGNTGSAATHDIDITAALLNKAGGWRTDHSIEVTCSAGQGVVTLEALVYDQIGAAG